MRAAHQARAEISAFVADELERQGGRPPSPEEALLVEELLVSFLTAELWLWEAPEHAKAQAALTSLRFALPRETRLAHQASATRIRTTLRDQGTRIAQLERTIMIQMDELIMLSEQLKHARAWRTDR